MVRLTTRIEGQSDAVVAEPTWAQIERAIVQMDGANRSQTALDYWPLATDGKATNAALVISGGEDGRVSVALIRRSPDGDWDQEFLWLCEPARGSASETRVAGGQRTSLPAKWWVSRETAIAAARTFIEAGRPDDRLRWETE